MQSDTQTKYFYNRERYYLLGLFHLEENKIDIQLTDQVTFVEQDLLQKTIDDRYNAIKIFQYIVHTFKNENLADIKQILAMLYDQDSNFTVIKEEYDEEEDEDEEEEENNEENQKNKQFKKENENFISQEGENIPQQNLNFNKNKNNNNKLNEKNNLNTKINKQKDGLDFLKSQKHISQINERFKGVTDLKIQNIDSKIMLSSQNNNVEKKEAQIGLQVIDQKQFKDMNENYKKNNEMRLEKVQKRINTDLQNQSQFMPFENREKTIYNQKLRQKLEEKQKKQMLFDPDKFISELQHSIGFSKQLLEQFYFAYNPAIDLVLDFRNNQEIAKINLIDSKLSFFKKSVFNGRSAFLNSFDIYQNIFQDNKKHPALIEYYYQISPFFELQEQIQKELIASILNIRKTDLFRVKENLSEILKQKARNQRYKKQDDNKISQKGNQAQVLSNILKKVEFDYIDFYCVIIMQLVKFNKTLHQILDQKDFNNKEELLTIIEQLLEFYFQFKYLNNSKKHRIKFEYLDYRERKYLDEEDSEQNEKNQEDFNQYKDTQSYQQIQQEQHNNSINNNYKNENLGQKEDSQEQQTQQQLKIKIETQRQIISQNELINNNYYYNKEENIKLIQNLAKYKLNQDELNLMSQEEQQQYFKQERQNILLLMHLKPTQEYIEEIFNQHQTINDQLIEQILMSAQVELGIKQGFNFEDQTIKKSVKDRTKVLRKALFICKYIWENEIIEQQNINNIDSHLLLNNSILQLNNNMKNKQNSFGKNYLYQLVENSYSQTQNTKDPN
ncbi:hypothetical protein PPERSA_10517 [Pseudocohnilembus persalinus]|uniref:Uncharacterized protein n=1 Tax=Pseudocohnilembus persalinus TaxID=266149 RepID=A0A0V0R7G4_PSEPJ|nr:hypothetical protein PPERSA_10517 [Pseudocohnilembus persalinus]|eukprot:KRX10418.1 hypothetical protein PPERSA_10517 [Pseudocohnilembus persalinus]